MQPKSVKLKLPCECTEHERSDAGAMLGAALIRIDELKEEHKLEAHLIKQKLQECQRMIMEKREVCATGVEVRDVPCELLPNYPQTGMKQLTRLDTGEVVSIEPMSPEEMQLEFEFSQQEARHHRVTAPVNLEGEEDE